MHQENLETAKKVKCSVITFFQAGSKILKAKALKALCVTGANEENSANRQVQDNYSHKCIFMYGFYII